MEFQSSFSSRNERIHNQNSNSKQKRKNTISFLALPSTGVGMTSNTEMDATNSSQSIVKSCKKQLKHSQQTSTDQSSYRSKTHLQTLYFTFIALLILVTPVCESLKVVSLNVPASVHVGTDLELECLYDLGSNATLYSLKWFFRAHKWERDWKEFFRYTPRALPHKQDFPLDGIHVDIDKSNGRGVYLRQIRASGYYMCEISVEGTFQTVQEDKMMSVISSSSTTIYRMPHLELQVFLLMIGSILLTLFSINFS